MTLDPTKIPVPVEGDWLGVRRALQVIRQFFGEVSAGIVPATWDSISGKPSTFAPSAHKTSHEPGGTDAMAVDAAAATGSLRTLGTTATSACAGNDSRLANSRTPSAHASSHSSGQSDAITVSNLAGNLTQARSHDSADTDSATSALHHTLGTGANNAAAGNHTHSSYLGGSSGSTDNRLLRSDGTGGATVQATGITVDDSDRVSGVVNVAFTLPASDHTATGIIVSENVGETTAFGDLLYLKSDGEWYKSDADAASTMPGMRMALEAKNDGEACKMLVYGWIRDDSWNWTVGGSVYASGTSGATTQTAPTASASQVQVVGIAYHADKLFFCPSAVLAEVK